MGLSSKVDLEILYNALTVEFTCSHWIRCFDGG